MGADAVEDFFTSQALASEYDEYNPDSLRHDGAIEVSGGEFEAENCNFHDNEAALIISSAASLKVNRSKFHDNGYYDVMNEDEDNLDFKYNWWGRIGGPESNGEAGGYKKLKGDAVDFSGWTDEENFHDPVILIPGILGSREKDGKMVLDPVFHTYDNLYQEFADSGYTPEKDLFDFPYEWQDSNIDNAKLLRDKINQIKNSARWPKVDLVAHSMGGLLAREYVESNYYQADVDQLVTLGTPQNGAPEAYLKWEGDVWSMTNVGDQYAKDILEQNAKEGGYADIFDYIHQRPVLSLQELLPVYNYLQDVKDGYQYKNYPMGCPRNEFLENLNKAENIEKLKSVELDKIVGKAGSETGTIASFKVIETDMGKWWTDGYPYGFEIPLIGDRGMIKRSGDGTVPLESSKSENIPADYVVELNSNHNELPTGAQKSVLELLTGKISTEENLDSFISNILITRVFSPIDIQIIDPDGKKVGKDFQKNEITNQISGAYYTGFDTSSEFITIPNPKNGQYKIIAQGTGTGSYTIKTAKLSEDGSGKVTESEQVFTGNATPGSSEEKTFSLDSNGTVSENKNSSNSLTVAAAEENSGSASDSGNNKSKNKNKKSSQKTSGLSVLASASPINLANNFLAYGARDTGNDFVSSDRLRVQGADNEAKKADFKQENFFIKWRIYFLAALALFVGGFLFKKRIKVAIRV